MKFEKGFNISGNKKEVGVVGNQSFLEKENKSFTDSLNESLKLGRENVGEVVSSIEKFMEENGVEKMSYDEITESILNNPNLFIRREIPEKIFDLLSGEKDKIEIRQNEDIHTGKYLNSAVLGKNAEGLSIPLQAGFGHLGQGEVVFVVGFKNGESIQSHSFDSQQFAHYGNNLKNMTAIEGEYSKEDIDFIMMRSIKSDMEKEDEFDERYFTETELKEVFEDETGQFSKDEFRYLGEKNSFDYMVFKPKTVLQ